MLIPHGAHRIRVAGLAKTTVVATQRAVEVAALDIQIVAENGATLAKVGTQMKKIVFTAADELDPEGHHLHETAGACA